MSIERLEKAIKSQRPFIDLVGVIDAFYALKKQTVVVSRKQLEEFLTFLYSQVPLFCTHGQNELDCMKPNSPCKRRHQKECPVYLRIMNFQELLGKKKTS